MGYKKTYVLILGRKLSISCACYLLLLSSLGCRKPYNPPAIASPSSYLVVEGAIISGADSTIIKLSRTVKLSAVNVNNPVSGATVTVQGDQNVSYPLQETTPGTYETAGLSLDNAHSYRLSINTGAAQYVSDYVPVLNSPPIDSVGFTTTGSGVNIYSNTHDPSNTVKYYRWDYQETWLYHPAFESLYVASGDTILPRTAQQQVYNCWPSDASSNIILNSSAKLSQDVIVDNPITSIASTSEKIMSEYSILVRQYALSADAYTFWQNMKQNSEQLGSIFDPQPSQINGNIRSVSNPNEPVIGYISVGAVSTKRIFIHDYQLPEWPPVPSPCILYAYYYKFVNQQGDTINQVAIFLEQTQGINNPYIPIIALGHPGQPPTGYSASSPACTECILQGPSVPPSFWQ